MFEKLTQTVQSAASKLVVRSALNPLLWLCAIVSIPLLHIATYFDGNNTIQQTIVIIGLTPIFVTCLIAIYLAIYKTEKLQSEEYQLRHEALVLFQEKSGRMTIDANSVQAIANPYTQQQLPNQDQT